MDAAVVFVNLTAIFHQACNLRTRAQKTSYDALWDMLK
jgi:hypothetical protein